MKHWILRFAQDDRHFYPMKSPRLFLRLALAFAPLALIAQPAAPAAPLGSTVFKWENLAVRPTGNGERRDVTDRPTATFERFESHVTTLLPGRMSHPPLMPRMRLFWEQERERLGLPPLQPPGTEEEPPPATDPADPAAPGPPAPAVPLPPFAEIPPPLIPAAPLLDPALEPEAA